MSVPHDDSDQQLLAHWETVHSAVVGSYERILERIEATGVPRQWFAVVHLLHGVPEHRMPMSRLARELMMTSGGFTKLADRMGREGLIDRRGSAGDRRVVFATLTPAGLHLAERTREMYVEALREVVLESLPEAALQALAAQLAPLQASSRVVRERLPQVDDVVATRGWDASAQPERRRRAATGSPDPVPLQAAHSSPM